MIKVCQYCGKEFKTYKNCVKYCSKEDAIEVRRQAELKYFGEIYD